MSMNEWENEMFAIEKRKKYDYRKLFFKLLNHWWVFLISVPLCVGAAYYYVVTKTPVYRVGAKVIISDTKKGELSPNAMMKELGLFQGDMFVENEMIELKSKNLMRNVVDELDLNIRYFQEGKFRDIEYYKNSPIKILVDQPEFIRDTVLIVNVHGGANVEITTLDETLVFKGNFSEIIPMGEYSISVEKNTENIDDQQVLVHLNSRKSAVESFYPGLVIGLLEKNTNAVQIMMNDAKPHRAIDMINGLIAIYNNNGITNKQVVSAKTVEFINDRLTVINQELGTIETDAETFKKENQLTDITSDAAFVMERKRIASSELLKLATELDVAKNIRLFMDRKDGDEFRVLPENMGLTDENLNRAIAKYNEMVLRRSKLLLSARESNPLVTGLEAQLREMKRSIQLTVGSVEDNLSIKLKTLEDERKQVDKQLTSVPTQEKQYRAIARQQELKENLFLFLMQKREEAEIAKLMYVPMAKIIEDPGQIGGAVSPKKMLIMVFGLICGCGLPVAIVILRGMLDTKVRNVEDVKSMVSAPMLGALPELSEGRTDVFQEDFVMSESMQLVRENLDYMIGLQSGTVIMVTSTIPGEGKSLVTSHLAWAYAKAGKKVIVLGCDLRNPRMNDFFKRPNAKGLSAYLAGLEDDPEAVTDKIDENLYVMFGGTVPPNPTQLITSPRMRELLDQLRRKYSCIILDTPPVGLLADGFALSKFTDACVYVVRAGVLKKDELMNIDELERSKRLKKMGIIVNSIKIARGGYGYKYYHYGYGYNKKGKK